MLLVRFLSILHGGAFYFWSMLFSSKKSHIISNASEYLRLSGFPDFLSDIKYSLLFAHAMYLTFLCVATFDTGTSPTWASRQWSSLTLWRLYLLEEFGYPYEVWTFRMFLSVDCNEASSPETSNRFLILNKKNWLPFNKLVISESLWLG